MAIDPRFLGTKTYRIGPGRHYRLGVTYAEGDTITVTDEVPGDDWTLVSEAKPVEPAAVVPKKK